MKYFFSILFVALPSIVFAVETPTDFRSLVGIFINLLNLIIPLIFGLTFIVLIWGITKAWILNVGDQAEIDKGKKLVVAGIIGLVVMSGIWGILALFRSSIFGL